MAESYHGLLHSSENEQRSSSGNNMDKAHRHAVVIKFYYDFPRGSAGGFSGQTPLAIQKCPRAGIVPCRQPAPPAG